MKKYPLSAAQRLHFYTMKYCPKKQVLNIGTSLVINSDIDWECLKKAIYKAYERCESMRLRFDEDENGDIYQYVVDKEERDIEFFDFTGWRMEDAKNKMRQWTETPFQGYNTPLNKVVMIVTPDNYKGIYLLVDHMTMDAQSLIAFLKDVIELYCNMKFEGVPYPEDMYSYIKQLEKDLEYEANSKKYERDKKFFDDLLSESEPIFCDVEGRDVLEEDKRAICNITDNTDANITVFSLEEEPSRRLMEFCSKNNIPMVCLLMMGLRTYFQKVNNIDDVSIMTSIARRATINEKRCGGTRIHFFPCRTIIDGNKSFLEGIEEIRKVQNALFRHANYDPIKVLDDRRKKYNLQSGYTYEPLSLTYQPLTMKRSNSNTSDTINFNEIDYKTAWYSNGVCAHALYLTVMHRGNDNGLDFNFEYQTGRIGYGQLEYLYYYLCKILFVGIENPNLSINEIISRV